MGFALSAYRTALEDLASLALRVAPAQAVRIETAHASVDVGEIREALPFEIPCGEGARLILSGVPPDEASLQPLLRLIAFVQMEFEGRVTGLADVARADDIARSAARRFEALFEGIPIACYACDRMGRLVEWNHAAEEIWGAGLAMAWGKDAAPILDPHDPRAERALLDRALGGETVRDEERELRLDDGETRHHLAYAFPLRDEGSVTGAMGLRLDITRRRAVQRELAERESLYRTVLETLAEGLILVDEMGKAILRNASADRILRIKPGDIDLVQAFPPEAVIDAEGRPLPPERWPLSIALQTGRPARDVLQGLLRPGVEGWLWIRVNAEPILREGAPRPVGAVATFREVAPPG